MKLLVAKNTYLANKIRDAFGLRREEWMTGSIGGGVYGSLFDEIVAFVWEPSSHAEEKTMQKYFEHLKCRLPKGKEIILIQL